MRTSYCLAILAFACIFPSAALADEYLVGRGIADITGPPVGVKMLGYVRPDQITEGLHLRQYAKAFVVAEPNDGRRLAIVVTDLQSVTHSLVLSVLDRLREQSSRPRTRTPGPAATGNTRPTPPSAHRFIPSTSTRWSTASRRPSPAPIAICGRAEFSSPRARSSGRGPNARAWLT